MTRNTQSGRDRACIRVGEDIVGCHVLAELDKQTLLTDPGGKRVECRHPNELPGLDIRLPGRRHAEVHEGTAQRMSAETARAGVFQSDMGRNAQPGDLIGERDHGRQHRVRRVLDHLRRSGIGDDAGHGVVETRVQDARGFVRALVDAPEDKPVGMSEVRHRRPFGQELRIHAEPEIAAGRPAGRALERLAHDADGRAGNDSALYDHRRVARPVAQRASYLGGRSLDESQVDLSVDGRL